MTISEQLKFLKEQLTPWVREVKGRVEIAADAVHLLGILATAPGAPRVVVLFDGEDKRGDYEELGKIDRKFIVVISRGRGFSFEPGKALTDGEAGGKALYDLFEEARELVRGLVFDRTSTDGIPNYTQGLRFTLEENAVDAYQINFTIGVQLPLHHQDDEA